MNIGEVEVFGKAVLGFHGDTDIDYDKIIWQGANIFPLLDNFSPADEMLQSLHSATLNHLINSYSLYENQNESGVEKLEMQRQDI